MTAPLNLHLDFECGKLGSSSSEPNAEVFCTDTSRYLTCLNSHNTINTLRDSHNIDYTNYILLHSSVRESYYSRLYCHRRNYSMATFCNSGIVDSAGSKVIIGVCCHRNIPKILFYYISVFYFCTALTL